MSKIYLLIISCILVLGCNKPVDKNVPNHQKAINQIGNVSNVDNLWGVWFLKGNGRKSVSTSFGIFEARGSHLVINPDGAINDIGYHLSITRTTGAILHTNCMLNVGLNLNLDILI